MSTQVSHHIAARRRTRPSSGATGPARRALGEELIGRLDALCTTSTVGLLDVALDLAGVTAAAVLGTLAGHVVGPLLAALYIGVRQRHISNLGHETVHSKLVPGARGNRLVGHVLMALLGEAFVPYRSSHSDHHAFLGGDQDPMFQSYRDRDIRRGGSTRRSFVLHVIVRNALGRIPAGAALTLVTRAPGESWRAMAGRSAVWIAMLTAAFFLHVEDLFVLYWLAPLILVRPVVTWITDLGNHAGVIESDDVLLQTRGWSSHWLTRHLLGGHLDDMYHPLHHWCPRLPFRRMPEAASLAAQHLARWPEVPWCSGFFFRRRSTPDRPCVIEDIIARLAAQTEPSPVPADA